MKISFTSLILSLMLMGGSVNASDLPNAADKALVNEANTALAQKDYKTAFAKFSVLAEQGKPAAQFNLGAFYLNGQGVQKDDKLAFEWLRKSAMQGNSRALQVIENSAARGNVYAIKELKTIKGQAEPVQEIAQPQVKPQEKPQEKPQAQARTKNRGAEDTLVYNDPTVAAPNKWVFGISAEYGKYKAKEPLYYPVGGVMSFATQSYSSSQPGVSVWAGFGDTTVMASYGKRKGKASSNVQGVGLLEKSFSTKETEIDARWLIRGLSSSHFMPYALAGFAQNSTSGTENEISFQDVYTQKDLMLMLGAGAIIPADQNIGFRVDGRFGADRQTASGSYVPGPGVTLTFNSYKYSATASFFRFTAGMYYKISGGWSAELGTRYGKYAAGIGPAFSDASFFVTAGYTFR
jgi:hypothetical protein